MLYKSSPQTLSLQDTERRDRKRDSCAIRHYLLFYFIVLLVSSAHLGKLILSLPRLLFSADIALVVTYPPFCSNLVQSINQSINFIYPRIYSVALKR